jgi:putative peptidoglycan lipid II flippase
VLRSALATILLNGGSNLLSFVNQLLIAAMFGALPALDAYFVGISLPLAVAANLGQMLSYAVMPLLVMRAKSDRSEAVGSALTFAFSLITLVLVAVGILASGPIVSAIGSSRLHGDYSIALASFKVFSVAGGLIVLTGIQTAIGNAHRSFLWPIIAGYGMPIGSTLAILVWGHRMGPVAIAAGNLSGTAVGCVLLGFVLRRYTKLPPYSSEDWRDVWRTLRQCPIYLLGLLPFSALAISDSFWGYRLGPSVVSSLGYSNRILVTVAGILMMGPISIIAQRLSETHSNEDSSTFDRTYVQGVRSVLWLGGLASVMLAVCANPIVTVLLQHGKFNSHNTATVALLLQAMAFGLIGTNCAVLSFQSMFARHQAKVAALFGVVLFATYFGLSGLLGKLYGAMGIGIAYTVTWWIVCLATLVYFLGRRILVSPPLREFAQWAATLLAVAAFGYAVRVGIEELVPSRSLGCLLVATTASSLASMAMFMVLSVRAFRVPEICYLAQRLAQLAKREAR